ncbi:hypothetical protein [Streptomyces sp. Da 82-17]|uniref:hypothetical protein n=1 Tax=Streptomyces sp. Da 82-17 TaxID=3377116 RepID=UPI0038D4E732
MHQGRAPRRQGAVNDRRTGLNRVFSRSGRSSRTVDPDLTQEPAMADLAFVVTTIAVFALVAVIAKGVAKL